MKDKRFARNVTWCGLPARPIDTPEHFMKPVPGTIEELGLEPVCARLGRGQCGKAWGNATGGLKRAKGVACCRRPVIGRSSHVPPDSYRSPLDQLHHDRKTPLTAIFGRTQLLTRMVQRSSSLTEPERVSMLDGLVSIEATVRQMVTLIDTIGRGPADGRVGDG